MKLLKRIPYWYLLVVPTMALYFGVLLNQLVIVANHNQMPVDFPASVREQVCSDPNFLVQNGDQIHTCMTPQTHLKFLADWIVMGNPTIDFIMSPGDCFIFSYELMVPLFYYMWIVLMIARFGGKREVVPTVVQDYRSRAPSDFPGGLARATRRAQSAWR